MQDYMGVALRSWVNKQDLWEANFVVTREWSNLCLPWKDVIGLDVIGLFE